MDIAGQDVEQAIAGQHVAPQLLEHALKYAEGPGDPLFTAWLNVRGDLYAACERAKVPPVSPNDLRRTCATWLRAQGAPPHLFATVLGHVDSPMVERVYGRLPIDQLAARPAQERGQNSRPYVGLVDRNRWIPWTRWTRD